MGYTHYWNKTAFTDDEWSKITDGAKAICKRAASEYSIVFGDFGGEVEASPVFDDSHIGFNGVDGDAHETFILYKRGSGGFCKTARKPYDIAVVSILLLAKEVAKIDISSDGDDEGVWESGTDGRGIIRIRPIDILTKTHLPTD